MNEPAIRALIAKWQEREDKHRQRAQAACGAAGYPSDTVNFDRQESAAHATMLCKRELEALLAAGDAAETLADVAAKHFIGPLPTKSRRLSNADIDMLIADDEREAASLSPAVPPPPQSVPSLWLTSTEIGQIMDALESDEREPREAAFTMIQDLHEPETLKLRVHYPSSPAVPSQETPKCCCREHRPRGGHCVECRVHGRPAPDRPMYSEAKAAPTATPAPAPHPAPSQNATSAAPEAQSAARADGRAGTGGKDAR